MKSLEKVMVVPSSILFGKKRWEGIRSTGIKKIQKLIWENHQFLTRSRVEDDLSYQQILPYLIFQHKEKIFLMRRGNRGKETRLHNRYHIGIGGHIRSSDLSKNDFFEWAKREFEEEVKYKGNLKIGTLGFLSSTRAPVDQYHLGVILWLQGDSDKISPKKDIPWGKLVCLDECFALYERMESWSKTVLDYLKG